MAGRPRSLLETTLVIQLGTRRVHAHLLCCWITMLGLACSSQRLAPSGPGQAARTPAIAASPVGSAFSQIPRAAIGQIMYVPVYSHIYFQDQERVINLTATLSIRNTDAHQAIRIDAVQYYDSEGYLVRSYVDEPLPLQAMASTAFVVEEDDTAGGVGANFIVAWSSEAQTTPPVVEAVMISAASAQGISFISVGRVIEEYSATNPE